jgi:hypothetical protein
VYLTAAFAAPVNTVGIAEAKRAAEEIAATLARRTRLRVFIIFSPYFHILAPRFHSVECGVCIVNATISIMILSCVIKKILRLNEQV